MQDVLRLVALQAARNDMPYSVAFMSSPQVNAYAVAGGHLYLNEGMLEFVEREAELAGILAHEISHVELRHCLQELQIERAAGRVAPGLAGLATLGYNVMERGFSERQELDADVNGALLAARAGYDAWEILNLFERIESPGRPPSREPVGLVVGAVPNALDRYLRTHPPADEKSGAVRRALVSRPEIWKGEGRYVGRANVTARRSRAVEPRSNEWITRSEPRSGPM